MILQILNRFFLTSTKVQSLKFDMYFEFVKQTVLKAEPISLHPQLAENVFYFIKPILKKKKTHLQSNYQNTSSLGFQMFRHLKLSQ